MKIKHCFVLYSCIVCLASLHGVDFWWMGAGQKQGVFKSFSDISNWRIGSSSGSIPENPPCESDSILIGNRTNDGYRKNFDLDGSVHIISGWAWTDNWHEHYTSMTNGTLRILGSISNRRETFDVYSDATFDLTSTSSGTLGDSGTISTINVRNGGCTKVCGAYQLYNFGFSVMPGGEMLLDPSEMRFSVNNTVDQEISNEGKLLMPNGLTISGYSKWNCDVSLYLRQKAGEMWIGGDVVRAFNNTSMFGSLRFAVSGGIVHLGCTPTFERANPSIEDGSVVTFDVAESCTLDFNLFDMGENVVVTNTGSGRTIYGPVRPQSLVLNGGILRVMSPLDDECSIEFANGSTVEFAVPGSSVETIGNHENISFVIDPSIVVAGMRILSSPDVDMLDNVAAQLNNSGLPEGFVAEVESGAVVVNISVESELTFACDGEKSLSDPSSWKLGEVPGGGSKVTVSGASTVAVLDSNAPAFGKIILAKGATLKVSGIVDVPPVEMNFDAKLLVPSGAKAICTNSVVCIAQPGHIPVFEVETNATVDIGSSAVFANVNLRLFGLIEASGAIEFGWAAAGQTAYFEMLCDGATFSIPSKTVRNFVCPEEGGRVVVPSGRLVYRNCTTTPRTSNDYHQGNIGYRNPSDIPFVFEISGCELDFGYRPCYVGGAANVLCVDGGAFGKFGENAHPGLYSWIQFLDSSKITLGNGGQFVYSRGNETLEKLAFMPTESGTEQMLLRDGGAISMHVYNGHSQGKAVVRVENFGYWDIPQLVRPNASFPDVTDTRIWLSKLFNKFEKVKIEADATLYLRSASKLWGDEWDRDVVVADVPVVGAGNICVTNDTPGYSLRVTMVSGRNTCTGSISASSSADGTKLLFADGANWAGTVVADSNVSFTNLTDSAPCTVDFGALRLDGEYAIRAWKDGNAFTNDIINVESGISGPGRIAVTPMNGFEFTPGDTLFLGCCRSTAVIQEDVGRKWKLVKCETSDPDVCKVFAVCINKGLVITFR